MKKFSSTKSGKSSQRGGKRPTSTTLKKNKSGGIIKSGTVFKRTEKSAVDKGKKVHSFRSSKPVRDTFDAPIKSKSDTVGESKRANRPKREASSNEESTNMSRNDERSPYRGSKKPTFGAKKATDHTKKPFSDSPKRKFTKDFSTDKHPSDQAPRPRFNKRPYKKIRTSEENIRPKSMHDGIRLNRYIANSGICSRREADTLIQQGLIEVNGATVVEMGVIVKSGDVVRYDGMVLRPEKNVYVLLNKPKDFITTTNDPEERRTVMNLVANACKERIYPVGRLDRQTTGLLLFTNDGELVDKLTHPSYNIKKIYEVQIDRPLLPEDAESIISGVYLDEGKAQVDSMAVLDDSRKRLGFEIHIGWNRVVRRIFEAKGYKVEKLDRVVYAGLTKKDLPRGTWRYLTEEEVRGLKYFNTASQ